MAKKRSTGRRRFNLRRVKITNTASIGALASADVSFAALTDAVTGTMRCMSLNGVWSLRDVAAATDDAYAFGVSHSDYSAAEIEECLEAAASIDLGDKVAQEQANRLVRQIGTFGNVATVGGGATLNDGKPVKTRLNWLLSIGDSLSLWTRNGSGTIYTTGTKIGFDGDLWVKDSA